MAFKGEKGGLVGILAFAKSYRVLTSFTFTVIKERKNKGGRKYSVPGTFSANPERKKIEHAFMILY